MNVGLLPTTIKPSLKGFERLIQFPASTEHVVTADSKSIKYFPAPEAFTYVPAEQNFDLFHRILSAKFRSVLSASKELSAQRDFFLLTPARKQTIVPNLHEAGRQHVQKEP